MTAIVPLFIKTKKQLIRHVADDRQLICTNPLPDGREDVYFYNQTGAHFMVPASFKLSYEAHLPVGHVLYVTNHKRTWFAQVHIMPNGRLLIK